MKKFVLLFVSLIMLSSCSTTLFNLSLNSVEYPSNSKEKYSETKIVKVESDGLSKYKYEDDFIKILWYVTAKQFHFELTNKSSYTIKLPWDDMAYIDALTEIGNRLALRRDYDSYQGHEVTVVMLDLYFL